MGYGYIEAGDELGDGFKVAPFKEKPDVQTATDYLNAGGFYWNSGMFLFRARRYLKELKAYRSDIYEACLGRLRKYLTGRLSVPSGSGEPETETYRCSSKNHQRLDNLSQFAHLAFP